MGRLLAVVLVAVAYGCKEHVREELKIDATESKTIDSHDSESKTAEQHDDVSIDKHQAPTNVTVHESDEIFGWAPPPPGSAPDAKPHWKLLRRKGKETEKKIGAVDTKKSVESDGKQAESKEADKKTKDTSAVEADKTKDKTLETSGSLLDLLIGWKVIAVILVVVGLGAVVYFKPNLLGAPARFLKSLADKFRKPGGA